MHNHPNFRDPAPPCLEQRRKPILGVAEAVEFLTGRIAEQARDDSVPLTEVERKQLSFTAVGASAEEIATANDFDSRNDSDEFEAKIAKLLRRVFRHDVQHGRVEIWQRHLAALRDQDIYLLVMVDQAGIPRTKAKLAVAAAVLSAAPRRLIRTLAHAMAGLVALSGFVYFFLLPMK
ncbi:MAG TPA: hypothetical protein VEI52_01875 [Terriglobales bacterium]|nr:hypothetical protein [Terriglobales bacterium]